jgi:flagellar biosynthetic protein FliR
MISLDIPLLQLQLFFLVFLRIGAIFMSMPVFDSESIPVLIKLALSLATALVLFPLLKLNPAPVFASLVTFCLGVAGEIIIGIAIGFAVKLVFAGIQLAGLLTGYQMGLAIANVMDPATSEQIPLLAQLNQLVALLIFITINAHYWFFRALAESFRLVPPLGVHLGNSLMEQITHLGGNMFLIAVQVGAPVIAALLIASVSFGLIARTVPQMNVFIVAIPLQIAVGLLFLGFSLPYFSAFLKKIFGGLGQNLLLLLRAMS